MQEVEDFKKTVRNHFPDLDLSLLESDSDEEVSEVKDEGLRVEDLFSSMREDQAAKEAMPAPPPTIIILSDCIKADESLAP